MIELKDIIKTGNIIKISPEETLSSALSLTRTSYDSVFVFDDKNSYMGVINPYYCLIKSSFPGNAKVKHCLYHPPKVRVHFSLAKVAGNFIESKVHYLPVFDDADRFLGIISARHLLSFYRNSPFLSQIQVKELLKSKKRPVITISDEESVTTAVHLFKKTRVSKLVVIGRDFKLKGVLSYYDLIAYLISPKNSEHKGEREGNQVSFYHQKIKNFVKTYAMTLKTENYLSQALDLILKKKIGSIIIIDGEKHPIGIVTTKDFLAMIMRNGNGKKADSISEKLSNQGLRIGGFFNQVNSKVKKFQYTEIRNLLFKNSIKRFYSKYILQS